MRELRGLWSRSSKSCVHGSVLWRGELRREATGHQVVSAVDKAQAAGSSRRVRLLASSTEHPIRSDVNAVPPYVFGKGINDISVSTLDVWNENVLLFRSNSC